MMMAGPRIIVAGLEPYKLTGVRVTDKKLGHCSYATVLELEYMGLKCAGIKIHELVQKQGDIQRFEEECHLLSRVRHPNIVQFLGVHFEQRVQAPILVMEFLPTNLTSCIDQYGIFPKDISYSILHDVALGLCYLHNQAPPIIHQDLSSNNVLLTRDMTAKICDLGVARILNLSSLQASQMTRVPGTPAYMPPEVMVAKSIYDTSVDVFSFGILIIHIFSGKWPEPQVGPERPDKCGKLIPVPEAVRREVFLRAIGNDHPLMDLILKCIDVAQARPQAGEIVKQLADTVSQYPSTSFPSRVEQMHSIELERLRLQIRDLNNEIQLVRSEKEATKAELNAEIAAKDNAILMRQDILKRKQAELKAKTAALEEKNATLMETNKLFGRVRELLSTQQQVTKPSVHITWEPVALVPAKLSEGKSTVINGKVCYGGGVTAPGCDPFQVYCYDPLQDNWSTLPPLPVIFFGLGRINNQLLAIGGMDMRANETINLTRMLKGGRTIRNTIRKYNEKLKTWDMFEPSLPTARHSPGVLSLEQGILVAGGYTKSEEFANTVEVFLFETVQWYRVMPLPIDCCDVSLAAIDGDCYVLGGYKHPQHLNQALHASIDDLLRNAVPTSEPRSDIGSTTTHDNTQVSPWKKLPHTPVYRPAGAVLAGNLFAIGGVETSTGGASKKEVYAFCPSTESWIYVSDLPTPLSEVSVNALSSTETIVIGGMDSSGKVNTAYKGTITLKL